MTLQDGPADREQLSDCQPASEQLRIAGSRGDCDRYRSTSTTDDTYSLYNRQQQQQRGNQRAMRPLSPGVTSEGTVTGYPSVPTALVRVRHSTLTTPGWPGWTSSCPSTELRCYVTLNPQCGFSPAVRFALPRSRSRFSLILPAPTAPFGGCEGPRRRSESGDK